MEVFLDKIPRLNKVYNEYQSYYLKHRQTPNPNYLSSVSRTNDVIFIKEQPLVIVGIGSKQKTQRIENLGNFGAMSLNRIFKEFLIDNSDSFHVDKLGKKLTEEVKKQNPSTNSEYNIEVFPPTKYSRLTSNMIFSDLKTTSNKSHDPIYLKGFKKSDVPFKNLCSDLAEYLDSPKIAKNNWFRARISKVDPDMKGAIERCLNLEAGFRLDTFVSGFAVESQCPSKDSSIQCTICAGGTKAAFSAQRGSKWCECSGNSSVDALTEVCP